MIKNTEVTIRDFSTEDIQPLLDYWYRTDPQELEFRGVDFKKLSSEDEMRESITSALAKNKLQNHLVVLFNHKPVGVHLINQMVPNESAVFHAHFWASDLRGKGIGTLSYPLACEIFFERFKLKKIIFRTPIQNTAALRVKEKLGIKVIGEEVLFGRGIIKDGTRVRVFELFQS